MNLEDLLVKTEQDKNKFEVLRSDGSASGHFIFLKDIHADDVILATARYARLLSVYNDEFDNENKQLKTECETSKDFTEYNLAWEIGSAKLKAAYAAELVSGWDFDNEFNRENLATAIEAFDSPLRLSLASQIINKHRELTEAYSKK